MIHKIVNNVNNKSIESINLQGGKDVGDLSDNQIIDIFKNAGNTLTLSV